MNNPIIDKLIEDSGMITHHKVINLLRERGWSLSIAPYYYDNISNTVREIDIVAEKPFNSDSQRQTSSSQVNVQLFIECKYIKQGIVFWFDDKNIDQAAQKLERDVNLDILYGKRHGADITADKFHYLTNDKVAKLFSANTNRDDVIYKALTQCLNSKIYYDQWFDKPIHHQFFEHHEITTSIIKYPLIICDKFDNFIEAKFEDSSYSYEKIKGNFQMEINYTYLDKTRTKTQTEVFLIDVIDFDSLASFLGILEKEVNSIIRAMSIKHS